MKSIIANQRVSTLPKYRRVEQAILEHIRQRKLKPGDRLPGERALAEISGVSAVTASRGINQLVSRGILERRQGHGTFVTAVNPNQNNTGTKHIGLITRYTAGDHYLCGIVNGITDVLNQHGYKLLVMASDEEYHLPSLREYSISGLVAMSPVRSRIDELLHVRETLAALVMVGYRHPELDDITFSCDDYDGGKMAVKHLAELGHRRIAVLGAQENPPSQERMAGFRKGMYEAGLPLNPDWEAVAQHYLDEARDSEVVAQLVQLFAQPDRPTALFAASPRLLTMAYNAAKAANLSIPKDLSLIGFDEIPHGEYVSPAPTVLRQPLTDIGAGAGRAMIAALHGQSETIARRYPATLIERDSCAPLE